MSRKYYITVCLLAKNENAYINEWLQWHVGMGIEHFYIYDNDSSVPLVESIDESYLPLCTVIDFPSPTSPRQHTQMDCYEHCLDNYKHECEWIAFIDGDEFIRLKEHDSNIHDFLKQYEQHDGLYVKWTAYNANGHMKKDDRPVRERFTTEVNFNIGYKTLNANGKTIIHADNVVDMCAHCPAVCSKYDIVDEEHKKVCLPYNARVSANKITVDHYYTKSFEEWTERISYGSCDPYCKRMYEDFYLFNPELRKE